MNIIIRHLQHFVIVPDSTFLHNNVVATVYRFTGSSEQKENILFTQTKYHWLEHMFPYNLQLCHLFLYK